MRVPRALKWSLPAILAILGCGRAETKPDPGPQHLLVVVSQEAEPYVPIRIAMLAELARLGHPQGEHLIETFASLGNHPGAAGHVWMADREGEQPIVFVLGTIAGQAFLPIARSAPEARFVIGSMTDPVGLGLIDGFGVPPKANITGIGSVIPPRERLRFLRRVMPAARRIGMVYGDMPQSASYRRWLEELATDPEFGDLRFVYRMIDFIPGDNGTARMAELAAADAREIDGEVDVFLAPVDQMGANPAYETAIAKAVTKPLVGLHRGSPGSGEGATMSIYSSETGIGRQAARMIAKLLDGAPIADLPPEQPVETGIAFDGALVERFGIKVPKDLADRARATTRD